MGRISKGTQAPVTMYEGLPGSGKSLRAVRELLRVATEERRPVYTNLPLQWRVIRRWMRNRWGEEIAGLIRPLDKPDFERFLARAVTFAQEWESVKALARHRNRQPSHASFVEQFNKSHGEPIMTGEKMNWIPPLSLIILDEVHKWYPADSRGRGKNEPDELLKYLSMIRHYVHELVVITQNRMQTSVTIRRMVGEFWHVRNMANEKVLWGIRWKHLGITAFQYGKFDPAEETSDPWKQAPETFDMVFPFLPNWRYLFRLYQSFTFAGRPWQREAEIRRAREMAGLSADGRTPAEIEAQRKRDLRKNKEGVRMKVIRMAASAMLCAGALGLGVMVGGARSGPLPEAQASPSEPERLNTTDIGVPEAWSADRVKIAGRWYGAGDRLSGMVVGGVAPRARRVFLRDADGVYWVVERGSASAQRLGTAAQIVRAWAGMDGRTAGGRGLEPDGGPASGSLEPGHGHALGAG